MRLFLLTVGGNSGSIHPMQKQTIENGDVMDDMFSPVEGYDIVKSVDPCPDMMGSLATIQEFVDRMKTTSKTTDKVEILKELGGDAIIQKALVFTQDPYRKYHLKSTNCKKNDHLCDPSYNNLWDLLYYLTEKRITGNDACAAMNGLVSLYPDYEELIFSILDKNMKIRASESTINKIYPKLIPTFKVALAQPFDPKRANWETEDWYGSRKLDGVRCIAIYNHDLQTVKMYSREGNEFETLQVVKDQILSIGLTDSTVFDGEVCIMDEDGNEDFQAVMKEIKRKDHTIEEPQYVLFDCLTLAEFESLTSERILSERIQNLEDNVFGGSERLGCLSVLEQSLVIDEEFISELVDDADRRGFEGIMVRKDVAYEGKRSYNLLKVKKFHDAEYEVVGTEMNENCRIIKDGEEVEVPVLAKAIIVHKGTEVGVGSGWTLDQRMNFYHNPELIVGRTITVQYFEESKNSKTGDYSLRFPVVKHIWESTRDI